MSNKLKVGLFQADLHWQAALKNLEKVEALERDIKKIDLLIMPEMFTTGFTMSVQNVAENWPGESVKRLQNLSDTCDTAIVCSIVIQEDLKYYNRLVFIKPKTKIEFYDKRHLFTMGEEHKYYSSGQNRLVVEYKSWRFMPLVCYDLRFPVWSRNDVNYDALIYVANWPDSRKDVWKTLLKARALENQSYVFGVNRVGKDGMGLSYSGNSLAFGPKGEVLANAEEYKENLLVVEGQKDSLMSFREKFPVLNDKDDFSIRTQ